MLDLWVGLKTSLNLSLASRLKNLRLQIKIKKHDVTPTVHPEKVLGVGMDAGALVVEMTEVSALKEVSVAIAQSEAKVQREAKEQSVVRAGLLGLSKLAKVGNEDRAVQDREHLIVSQEKAVGASNAKAHNESWLCRVQRVQIKVGIILLKPIE